MGNNIYHTPKYHSYRKKMLIFAKMHILNFYSDIGSCWIKACGKQCQVSFKNIYSVSMIYLYFQCTVICV